MLMQFWQKKDIRKCTSEEADPRVVRHVINLGKNGYTEVLVKTTDSDIVILCISYSELAILNGIITFFVVYGPKLTLLITIVDLDLMFAKDCLFFTPSQAVILFQVFLM